MLLWIGFFVLITAALALDLGVFHKEPEKIKVKQATAWSIVWVTLSLLFSIVVYYAYAEDWSGIRQLTGDYIPGDKAVVLYLTGYLLELSLSLDNIFVMALIFAYFKVPTEHQHRVLFWGILGAVIFRAIMIFAGVALIQRFTWLIYIFGAFIIFAALKMWATKDEEEVDLKNNWLLRRVRKVLPITRSFYGQQFFIKRGKMLLGTPLLLTLLMIEMTDILFALDSIPAIFSITTDSFLIFTSNIFAILGLRSMYFMLAAVLDTFKLLKYSVIAILLFVGLKMVSHGFIHLPEWASLAFIAGALLVGVVASLFANARREADAEPGI
ncbi:MAG: TerC/Alx family metal homeostasis membrane protein [Saprospiraceae bacterium]|nr:TerC/Alx family metal homeostasis membrane protein [Saprospiraceae bacterium]